MDKWQALHRFWNSFNIPAYEVSSVPDDAGYPRITYSAAIGSIDNDVQIDASVWDKSTSWGTVDGIVNQIESGITAMDCPVIEGGRYRVYKGTPFAQRLGDTDNEIRRTVLHVNFEFLTE